MRDQEWDPTATELHALDLAELVLGLLGLDAVHGEAALGVVDEAEVLAGLLDRDDVHETRGVGDVGADLVVDLDEALHHDGLGLTAVGSTVSFPPQFFEGLPPGVAGHVLVEGISQTVADEDDEGQAVAKLVGTSTGFLMSSQRRVEARSRERVRTYGSVGSTQLVQHPRAGRAEALLVLLAIVGVSLEGSIRRIAF